MSGWVVGAAINLLGSVMINFGTNMMKLGHNKRAEQMAAGETPKGKNKHWLIGVSVFAVGNVLNFVSFGFAAQSLLAALGSVQFVANVVFAKLVLSEHVGIRTLISTGMIVAGCIVLVLFGNHTSETQTADELIENYKHVPYIVYLIVIASLSASMFFLYRTMSIRQKKLTGTGESSALWTKVAPICFALYAALIGTQSVLFSKTISVLLRTTLSGENQLATFFFWIILVCFLVTCVFWLTRLNLGLRLFPAIIIVPVLQINWTVFSIVSGMVYFQEYTEFDTFSACMFALGVAIVITGVLMLTLISNKEQAKVQQQQTFTDVHVPGSRASSEKESPSSPMLRDHKTSGFDGAAGSGADVDLEAGTCFPDGSRATSPRASARPTSPTARASGDAHPEPQRRGTLMKFASKTFVEVRNLMALPVLEVPGDVDGDGAPPTNRGPMTARGMVGFAMSAFASQPAMMMQIATPGPQPHVHQQNEDFDARGVLFGRGGHLRGINPNPVTQLRKTISFGGDRGGEHVAEASRLERLEEESEEEEETPRVGSETAGSLKHSNSGEKKARNVQFKGVDSGGRKPRKVGKGHRRERSRSFSALGANEMALLAMASQAKPTPLSQEINDPLGRTAPAGGLASALQQARPKTAGHRRVVSSLPVPSAMTDLTPPATDTPDAGVEMQRIGKTRPDVTTLPPLPSVPARNLPALPVARRPTPPGNIITSSPAVRATDNNSDFHSVQSASFNEEAPDAQVHQSNRSARGRQASLRSQFAAQLGGSVPAADEAEDADPGPLTTRTPRDLHLTYNSLPSIGRGPSAVGVVLVERDSDATGSQRSSRGRQPRQPEDARDADPRRL
ncbi:unnamed protein product [Pedinophyceae sp. YPF-701]|nr:unnamed protein product [Pedinophyceae sp. YPF-701]